MSSFDARLRLPGQARLPMSVVVDVAEGRLIFTKEGQELGNWPLEKVVVNAKPDGFHLSLGQEEIFLSVTDSARFAGALGARAVPAAAPSDNGGPTPQTQLEATSKAGGISARLEAISPEDQVADVRRRISELKASITDESVAPPEVFRRWLRLLKELNLRHGQGAIPTSVFYKLNTEVLELIPVPASTPPPIQPELVGVRL